MPFETKQRKKFRKRTDRQGNVFLDALWQGLDSDKITLPCHDHLKTTMHLFKKQANLFVRRLSKEGAFQKFPMATQVDAQKGWVPKGYEVALKIPLHCGGNYHFSNLVLLPQGYHSIYYDLYLRQLADEMMNLEPQKQLFLTLPHMPNFMTPDSFLKILFPEDRKQVLDFFKKQKLIHQQSVNRVIKKEEGNKIYLKLNKNPTFPFGCSYRFVRVHFPSLLEREEAWHEYTQEKRNLLIQAIDRGDFDFLAPKEKERLIKTHQLSLDLKLTCHHLLPRQLGGKNTLENVVWMSEKDHQKIHQEALNPLGEMAINLFEKNEKREIYIALPIPEKYQSPLPLKRMKKGPQYS